MNLNQSQLFALRHALDDHDFRVGLAAFLQSQLDTAKTDCCEAMHAVPAQIERAIGLSARAYLAAEYLNLLEAFVTDQLSQQ